MLNRLCSLSAFRMRLTRVGLVALAFGLSAGVASAGTFSFTGVISGDDQVQVLLFTAPSSGAFARTWSYAGGTNTLGQVISAGGFDPVISVFDASNGLVDGSFLIDSSNDGAGVAEDPVTHNAFDSLLLLPTLNPGGTYALVISENGNLAIGPTYGDGFSRSGQGDFTATANGCFTDAPFCENPFLLNRTGQWAVDIGGTDAAGTELPEPASLLLLVTGIVSLALLRRCGKQA